MSANRPTSRRLLGCLIKGPLGCFAFLVGAAVVGVLFLPPTGGRHMADAFVAHFNGAVRGSLEVNDVWLLSMLEPQGGRFLLRDPDGREILRGTFTAPPLTEVLDEDGLYGPLSVHLDFCDIVTDSKGVTNLRRAFERRRPDGRVVIDADWRTSGEGEIALELLIDQFIWREEGTDATFETRGFRGGATLRLSHGRVALDFKGRGDVVDEQPGHLEARVYAEDLTRVFSDGLVVGSVELKLQGVDSAKLDLITGQRDAFVVGFGPRTEVFALGVDRVNADTVTVRLDVTSPLADLALSGRLDLAEHRLVAGPGDELRASFAPDSAWVEHVIPSLLPVMNDVRAVDPMGVFTLESTDFSLPLHRDLAGLGGVFSLRLAPLTYRIDSRLQELLVAEVSPELSATETQVVLGVNAGVVRYDAVMIPFDSGAIAVDGDYDLRSGDANILVRLPAEFVAGTASVFHVTGPWAIAQVERVD